jgi:hypothetical protein
LGVLPLDILRETRGRRPQRRGLIYYCYYYLNRLIFHFCGQAGSLRPSGFHAAHEALTERSNLQDAEEAADGVDDDAMVARTANAAATAAAAAASRPSAPLGSPAAAGDDVADFSDD